MHGEPEREIMRKKRNAIVSALKEVEAQSDTKFFNYTGVDVKMGEEYIFFIGCNGINYSIPYELFMSLPQKRLVIEVARALSIEFNDYGEGC
ncbi:MAG: hypothetical protein IKW90_15790 [Lachnospiraceae bacterium]|nr:hypothetical protein [Lachnospiraceae bacterium]